MVEYGHFINPRTGLGYSGVRRSPSDIKISYSQAVAYARRRRHPYRQAVETTAFEGGQPVSQPIEPRREPVELKGARPFRKPFEQISERTAIPVSKEAGAGEAVLVAGATKLKARSEGLKKKAEELSKRSAYLLHAKTYYEMAPTKEGYSFLSEESKKLEARSRELKREKKQLEKESKRLQQAYINVVEGEIAEWKKSEKAFLEKTKKERSDFVSYALPNVKRLFLEHKVKTTGNLGKDFYTQHREGLELAVGSIGDVFSLPSSAFLWYSGQEYLESIPSEPVFERIKKPPTYKGQRITVEPSEKIKGFHETSLEFFKEKPERVPVSFETLPLMKSKEWKLVTPSKKVSELSKMEPVGRLSLLPLDVGWSAGLIAAGQAAYEAVTPLELEVGSVQKPIAPDVVKSKGWIKVGGRTKRVSSIFSEKTAVFEKTGDKWVGRSVSFQPAPKGYAEQWGKLLNYPKPKMFSATIKTGEVVQSGKVYGATERSIFLPVRSTPKIQSGVFATSTEVGEVKAVAAGVQKSQKMMNLLGEERIYSEGRLLGVAQKGWKIRPFKLKFSTLSHPREMIRFHMPLDLISGATKTQSLTLSERAFVGVQATSFKLSQSMRGFGLGALSGEKSTRTFSRTLASFGTVGKTPARATTKARTSTSVKTLPAISRTTFKTTRSFLMPPKPKRVAGRLRKTEPKPKVKKKPITATLPRRLFRRRKITDLGRVQVQKIPIREDFLRTTPFKTSLFKPSKKPITGFGSLFRQDIGHVTKYAPFSVKIPKARVRTAPIPKVSPPRFVPPPPEFKLPPVGSFSFEWTSKSKKPRSRVRKRRKPKRTKAEALALRPVFHFLKTGEMFAPQTKKNIKKARKGLLNILKYSGVLP